MILMWFDSVVSFLAVAAFIIYFSMVLAAFVIDMTLEYIKSAWRYICVKFERLKGHIRDIDFGVDP